MTSQQRCVPSEAVEPLKQEIVEALQRSELNGWELRFISEQLGRLIRFGKRTVVSKRQVEVLQQILARKEERES
jgi:hypothetical protein